jgi:tetratricopeptide (TPR) repeat protein
LALAFLDRGSVYLKKRDYDRAILDYSRAMSLRPRDSETLGYRGFSYLMLKKLDLALADYDAAVRANPRNAFAIYGRGTVEQLKGDTAGGNADIAAAKLINPNIAKDFERYYGVHA